MARKKVNIVANKRAINRIGTYKKNVAKGKELHSEVIEEFERNISPYLTKKGTVRKNLSKKRQEEFNQLVTDFKKTTAYSKTKATQKRKRTVETAEKRGTYTKKESKKILETFESSAVRDLSKKGILDSDQVVALIKEYRAKKGGVSKEDFEKVAEYLIEQKQNVPAEVSGLVSQDDTYMLAEELLNNIDKIDFDAL